MEAKVTTKKVKAPEVEVPVKAEVKVDAEKVADVAETVTEQAEGVVKTVRQRVGGNHGTLRKSAVSGAMSRFAQIKVTFEKNNVQAHPAMPKRGMRVCDPISVVMRPNTAAFEGTSARC